MNHESEEVKIKPRIIEIDRKLAAQLADVWIDMKQRIETQLKKKEKKSSKLRNEVKDD